MKDNTIDREEIAWMITRCAGVTFALLALIACIPAIMTLATIMCDFPASDQNNPELAMLWRIAKALFFTGGLFGFTAYCFLQYGSSFKWLARRVDSRQQEDFVSGSDSKVEGRDSAEKW